jgi:hypothetical protein
VVSNIFHFPFHIWVVILPFDELIFFRGVGQPPIRKGFLQGDGWSLHVFAVKTVKSCRICRAFCSVVIPRVDGKGSISVYILPSTGWWFGTMEFYDFPFSWECHHPN